MAGILGLYECVQILSAVKKWALKIADKMALDITQKCIPACKSISRTSTAMATMAK